MNAKIIFTLGLVVSLLLIPDASAIQQNNTNIISNEKIIGKNDRTLGVNPIAIIETSMGDIEIELYKDLVPNTVNNFIKLAESNFYDGLVFHRVIDDFVIQGGGYYSNGTNKQSPYGPIDLEINPDAEHVDGAIGMARTSDPNSATSQFYICDGAQHFLDGDYAVFGKVTEESMSVVRSIASVGTTTKYGLNDWPVDDIIIKSLTIYEPELDIDVMIRGGFCGFKVKIHNNGPEDYNKPISISFDAEREIRKTQLYNFSILSTENIPVDKWITLKSINCKFMFGFAILDISISLDFGNDGKIDEGITKKGFLLGPFVIMLPSELRYNYY